MKTKENFENIYKIMNAWLRNCRTILAFIEKDTKRERERDREEKMVEEQLISFLVVFL